MADFPVIYGEAQTGKTKMWKVRVYERDGCGVIETSHGYEDGKIQVNDKIISEGKNIGKRNETTPLQQAVSDARAAWTKKSESGYAVRGGVAAGSGTASGGAGGARGGDDSHSISSDDVDAGRSKGISSDAPSVMLAHDYTKRSKDIKFPCYVQRKYDGVRCVAVPNAGLFSRLKKSFPHLNHIKEEINRLPHGVILDGELYSDGLTFQEIVGIVKREALKKGDDEKLLKIKLHVYDIINDMPYSQRYANLQLLFRKYKFKHLELVATEICDSVDKMKELHSNYVAEGYEGIMLRNKEGVYKGARSNDLQKYKEFFDAEYKIIGYEEGKGLEDGCVIWKCVTSKGKVFSCRPRGSREDRQCMYLDGDKYINKMLTVRYQEETDEGLPRFPVGITIRDYE
jgi:hypothetical protein